MASNLTIQPDTETLSEISEATTTSELNSQWNSKEDLQDLAIRHGLKDLTDLYQERFKIDRRKLEQMLAGDNNTLIPADIFFAEIMENTDTYITWPNKIKLGGKSKKDPHVRVIGAKHNVETAKERILALLYTRCNRITMKMDISYTDHSHIIGKGGRSIKRVMSETQCHIHFPDSNRMNMIEKSNQVSISGNLEGVERARSRLRELIPLIFGFEPPVMVQHTDNTSPYIVKIQEEYNVEVMYKTRSKLHSTIILVKGAEWEMQQVKKATLLLMEYICGNLCDQIPVQMSIQISPQHHPCVLGRHHSYLKAIIQHTGCQIMFPDAQDPNIPILKRNNVNISGNIHGVYKARQLLIGSLPLMITFNLPDDSNNLRIKTEQINEIQFGCDVTINIRQKSQQIVQFCIIKGIERNAVNIYRARNLILGIDELPLYADIPRAYHLPTGLQTQYQEQLPAMWQHNFSFTTTFGDKHGYDVAQPSTSSSGYHSLSQASNGQANCENSTNVSPISCKNVSEPANDDVRSDYETKRLAGLRAMQTRPNPSVYRWPTDHWSGYGLSHTSPALFSVDNDTDKTKTDSEEVWKIGNTDNGGYLNENNGAGSTNPMSVSNITENTSPLILNNLQSNNWDDLPSLLNSIGLDKYVSIFLKQEIDLVTFGTLTEKDLIEIGINAFGSRRKLLLAISELNKRSSTFAVAPGAERSKTLNRSLFDHKKDSW